MVLGLPIGGSTLLIGAVVFVLILIGTVGVALWVIGNPFKDDPAENFAAAAEKIIDEEDADAIAFVPYSDGPMVPKAAVYDRELLGGKGGYRTKDGDKIYVDGEGNGVYSLFGVDVVLAIDPTEHAAAADPIKAWTAYKSEVIGEYIKVDDEGRLLEVGEALKQVDGPDPALPDGGSATMPNPNDRDKSLVHEHAVREGMSLKDAYEELEKEDLVHKLVDLAPPADAVIDEETGTVDVRRASHVAVDISNAAELLPKKTNTTDWQTAIERAKNEARNDEELMTYLTYGALLGGGMVLVAGLLFAGLMYFAM